MEPMETLRHPVRIVISEVHLTEHLPSSDVLRKCISITQEKQCDQALGRTILMLNSDGMTIDRCLNEYSP